VTTPTPTPPTNSFASDNAAGVDPAVLDALAAANVGPALAYGEDPWTARASAAMDELFGRPVETFACWGGTGANVVGLASVIEAHQCVLAVDSAHIVVDECGAPVRFSGSTIQTVPAVAGKFVPEAIEPFAQWLGSEHHPQPAVVSISQATEMGTCYSVDEIGALCDRAHAHSMLVHLDGARIANAVAASGVTVEQMVAETGVDVMTFGMTKNGAMYGEVVVFLRPELARRAAFVRKQAGQLPSKARFVAAQLLALLEGDRWLHNASQANAMATLLADRVQGVPGVQLVHPPEVNSVFVRLPLHTIESLQRWSFFWEWDLSDAMVRWMTSFVTTPEDVDAFAAGVATLLAESTS
jgi:threonine aldolase